jgi:hypothetical protein
MQNKIYLYLRLGLLVGVPIVLLLLPKTFFDTGTPLCPSMLLFHEECPGCGMTRACMYLIHLDPGGAIYFNAASVVVFPVFAFLWAKWFWTDWKIFRGQA